MQAPTDAGRLIITPHPVMLDGQQNLQADLRPGESLYGFLARHVHGLDGQAWVVTIGGRPVERHLWCNVYPKHGQVIEVRGVVGRSAIRLVAMIALTYFTLGGAAIAGFSIGTSTVLGTTIARIAVYVAGSLLINKVLGPKLPSAAATTPADTAFSISAPRNRARAYEPLSLLFGSVRIAPDVASKPYLHYEGDEQYLSLVLTPGVNVGRVEALYNGDALLSSYEGVQVWHNGFPGMPSQAIPLYSNSASVDGGTILDTSSDPKHTPSKWVQRTSASGAIRLQVNMDFRIFDADSKGREYENREQIQIQYRAVGESAWRPFGTYSVSGRTQKSRRATYGLDVAPGQYEVQVRTTGQNTDGNNAQASFTWTNLVSVMADTASYDGIPRIGIRMKASGQLNGSPDELRCVAHALPIPVWKGDAIGWVTEESSNPGAQILAYARGIKSPAGVRIGGMGLPDSQIDVEALKAFMLHCAANGFTYDYLVTDKRNHQAVMDAIALAGFGQIAWPKGRLAVVWAADEQPLSGVVNMATIKKGQFQVEYTLANGADGIEYSYLDRATWEARTLRVPAPGVSTMLNPAQVTGEGVTSEAHAATLARWHLAQSLYQYKSISYSTNIEHLAYGRMSVLALQHDLTQWGFGGQVLSATMGPGRAVTLQLDVPVPGRAQASAYIGLRIPGERVYRVLRVRPFTGESDQLVLADPWPTDAALPGDSEGNPAWDTIWIYDFKQTPGYRVRVVSVQPEDDLKGAAVDVVAEGPEYWHYVKTGEYIPPDSGSQLGTRPVASNLRITERQVVQGDTVFSELQASFDISGPVGEIRVLSDLDQNAELEQVASTTTRTASWRIPRAGVYPITVRPYSPDGQAGVAVTVTYATQGADVPPVLVDLFDVEERSGGVRLYTWGWLGGTTRSPDFAGVEIRYMPGKVAAPDWHAMTPVGETGYHTAPFENVIPESGDWTFACRSVNTSGELSTESRVVMKTLGQNLGEVLDKTVQKMIDQQRQIDQEKVDRFNEDARVSQQAAADATAKANAARDAAIAHADAIAAIVSDITEADEWVAPKTYPAGDFVKHGGKLYRALRESTGAEPGLSPEDWQLIGNFAGVGEALAASIDMSFQNASDLAAEAGRINAILARMPAGDGKVASVEAVDAVNARVEQTEGGVRAVGERTTSLEAQLSHKHTGDRDWHAGDRNVRAGVRTWQSVIAEKNRAVAKRVDITDSALGAFKGEVTRSIEVIATEQAAQAEQIEHVGAELEGKASADALRQVSSRVEQTEGGLQAVSGQLESVKADLGGKASAQVVQGMEARVVQTEQGLQSVRARAFLKVIADAGLGPLIGGMEIDNDGNTVATRFVSNLFEILSPNAASGIEIRNGYLRVWGGNAQRIIGVGFGKSADRLMDYFGPNVGAGNASKLNATMWMDMDGNGYWGGALRAGAINSGGQFNLNNANWDSATYLSVMHAGSQGRSKVVLRWARLSAETVSFGNASLPTRTGTMRLRLWRDSTLLSDQSITASSVNVYEPDSNRTLTTQTWEWPQLSITDTSNATGNVPYRMQIDFTGGTRYDIPASVVGALPSVAVLNIIES
ncbi:host specificity factor TipJ family phage tail protein [Stenotrophomonas maltophilia]